MISPELDALIQTFKLPKSQSDGSLEFHRIKDDQYIAFKHAFVEQRLFNETYKGNKGNKAMDLILSTLCAVLCNRVPKGIVPFSINTLQGKIKLVNPPRGVEVVTKTVMEKDQEVVIEKNTNEKAIVRIMVPKRT